MSQIVTINGRPMDLDWAPSLKVGNPPLWRPPSILNSRMVHGVTINGYDYPPCPSGAVLYLPGLPGQGSTIWDRSPEGNHGAITGATWKRLPSGLPYLNFDGTNDYVNCGNSSIYNFTTGSFTLMCWLNPTPAGVGHIFNRGRGNVDGWYAQIRDNGEIWVDTHQSGAEQRSRGTGFAGGAWWHFAAVRDGTSIIIYRNAVDVTSVSGTHIDPVTNTRNLYLGVDYNASSNKFEGYQTLHDIVNEPLTQTQIANIVNQERHLLGV